MGGETMMNELPSTTCLSSELCDAFSEYLERAYPHPGPFSWNKTAQVLSAFTGVSVHFITTALASSAACETATVSKAELRLALEALMRIDGDTDAWWESPDVTMLEFTGPVNQEARDAADSRADIGVKSLTSAHARSHRPSPPNSTSREGPPDSEMGAGSRQPSLRPTLNSWGSRGSRLSDTCSLPGVSLPRPHNTAASMECVVAAAMGELDMFIEDEQCSIQFHPGRLSLRFSSEVPNEAERFGALAQQGRRVGDRSCSPSPAHPAGEQAVRPSCPPIAPTLTLAELDRFVHRGKTSKVCKQFVQTGRCTFGARCLYHHPSTAAMTPNELHAVPRHLPEDAPKPVGSCIASATARGASLHRSLTAPMPGSFLKDALSRSAWLYVFPVPPITPTYLSEEQVEAATMTEREREESCSTVSPPSLAGAAPAALLNLTVRPSGVQAPLAHSLLPQKGSSARAMSQSTPPLLPV
ncbi:Zinc finger Cx8Cx5Cx3H type [Leishmania braziliensis]|nr:Zinc finger Cx8Cx5Cx3H type [Leishmania braziliensis]CAJ2477847.1 unnamed protein product [Leishmania braziliensis]